jgi:hypothetical protein
MGQVKKIEDGIYSALVYSKNIEYGGDKICLGKMLAESYFSPEKINDCQIFGYIVSNPATMQRTGPELENVAAKITDVVIVAADVEVDTITVRFTVPDTPKGIILNELLDKECPLILTGLFAKGFQLNDDGRRQAMGIFGLVFDFDN